MNHEELREKVRQILYVDAGQSQIPDRVFPDYEFKGVDAIMALFDSTENQIRLDECHKLKKHIDYNENGQNKVINSRIKHLTTPGYNLQLCPFCNQMTNHRYGMCMKHTQLTNGDLNHGEK